MMSHDRLRRTGFTLVEMVVVVIVLGLSASIVALRMAGPLQRARAESAAQTFLNIDHFARTLSDGRNVKLVIDTSDQPVQLKIIDSAGEVLRQWSLPSTITIRCESIASEVIEVIRYPHSGGTTDYRVIITDGYASLNILIAGGTGHAIQSWN
jgi:prepilin-type N-terminal cleavage/methylation domain-containing protein